MLLVPGEDAEEVGDERRDEVDRLRSRPERAARDQHHVVDAARGLHRRGRRDHRDDDQHRADRRLARVEPEDEDEDERPDAAPEAETDPAGADAEGDEPDDEEALERDQDPVRALVAPPRPRRPALALARSPWSSCLAVARSPSSAPAATRPATRRSAAARRASTSRFTASLLSPAAALAVERVGEPGRARRPPRRRAPGPDALERVDRRRAREGGAVVFGAPRAPRPTEPFSVAAPSRRG